MNARENRSNPELPSPSDPSVSDPSVSDPSVSGTSVSGTSVSGTALSSARGVARWWLIPLALILVVLVIAGRRNALVPGGDSPSIGKPAPQIDLVSLSADLQLPAYQWQPGRVTLLHFWGTWCGPCMMEYPQLSEMAGQFRLDERFDFVPVTCEYGSGETFEGLWNKTHEYLQSNRIDSAAYADPRGVTRRSAAERLQRDSLFYPTSMLIDHQGEIAGVWEGYTPDAVDQIKVVTDRLIAKCRD